MAIRASYFSFINQGRRVTCLGCYLIRVADKCGVFVIPALFIGLKVNGIEASAAYGSARLMSYKFQVHVARAILVSATKLRFMGSYSDALALRSARTSLAYVPRGEPSKLDERDNVFQIRCKDKGLEEEYCGFMLPFATIRYNICR